MAPVWDLSPHTHTHTHTHTQTHKHTHTHTHTHTQVKKMNTIFVIWVKGLTLPPNMWQISFNWLFQC